MKRLVAVFILMSLLLGILASCVGGSEDIKVEKIYFEEEEITVKVGERVKIEALVYPKSASDADLEWESSNEDVATVSNGRVKGISEGTAIISATSENGKCATCRVTVIDENGDEGNGGGGETDNTPVGNKIGDKCPTYNLSLLDGSGTVNITEFKGKIVIINFWGTWCGPCKTELPHFDRIADEYKDEVVVLTVHSSFSSKDALSYVQENYPDSNMIFAIDEPLTSSMDMYYNLLGGKNSYPRTIILDEKGIIQKNHDGAIDYEGLKDAIGGSGSQGGEGGGVEVVETLDLANGSYSGSEVTITFWHTMSQNNKAILEDAIARFNEEYPNIKVDHRSYGDYDEVFDQVKVKLTAGKQPNIAFCYPDHVAAYNYASAVITLDELMANGSTVYGSGEMMGLTQAQLDDYIDGFLDEGREYGDGKMYTLPFQKSTEVLYYNKTIFEANGLEAPETWDDVENAIKVLKEIYPNSIPLGYDSEENFFITMTQQYGSSYTSSTGEHYLFNNEVNKSFIAKYAEWYQKDWMRCGLYTSDGFRKANDETGKIFMSIASSSGARYQRPDKIGSDYPFEVGIVPVPQINPYNPKTFSQGPSLCIFEDTNPDEVYASWLFVKFLTTDTQFQAQYSMNSGYVPVIESAADDAVYQAYLSKADGGDLITSLAAKVALEQNDYYFSTPAFVGSADARTNVGLLVMSVFEKYSLNGDNRAMIDTEFKKFYDLCNE